MRKAVFLLMVLFITVGPAMAQVADKKTDKKEQKDAKKEERKADKEAAKNEKSNQSFGELAQETGKNLWNGFRRQLGKFADDLIDKKDKLVGDGSKPPKEKKDKTKMNEEEKKDTKTSKNNP